MRGAILTRSVSCVLILALCAASVGCSTTRVIAPEALGRPDYPKDRALKLTYTQGVVILRHVFVIDWPVVEGEIEEIHGDVPREPAPNDPARFRFDVSKAETVEDYQFSRGRTAGLVAGVAGGVIVVATIAVAVLIDVIVHTEARHVPDSRPRSDLSPATDLPDVDAPPIPPGRAEVATPRS